MPKNLPKALVDSLHTDGFYVYILRCEDDSLYTGWTTNLSKRFYRHAIHKGAKYTRAHHVIELYYYESCASKQEAMKREYEIKQLSRAQKLALPKLKQE